MSDDDHRCVLDMLAGWRDHVLKCSDNEEDLVGPEQYLREFDRIGILYEDCAKMQMPRDEDLRAFVLTRIVPALIGEPEPMASAGVAPTFTDCAATDCTVDLSGVVNAPRTSEARPTVEAAPERYECESCSGKSGSPVLCPRCIEARNHAGDGWIGPRYMAPEHPRPNEAHPLNAAAKAVLREWDGVDSEALDKSIEALRLASAALPKGEK